MSPVIITKKSIRKNRADPRKDQEQTTGTLAAKGPSRPPANHTVIAASAGTRKKKIKFDDQGGTTGTGGARGSSSRSSSISSKKSPSMEENYDAFYDDNTQQQETSIEQEGKTEGDYNANASRKRSYQLDSWSSRSTSPLKEGPPLDAEDTESRKRPAISSSIPGAPADDKSAAEEEEIRWNEQQHRQLVDAIYQIGVSHASPSVIIENMILIADVASSTVGDADSNKNPVTSERVKSHLQKYRKNKNKSREEFLQEYDQWMQKALTMVGGVSAAARTSLVSTPTAVVEMVGGRRNQAASDLSSSNNKGSTDANETYQAKNLVLGGALPALLTYSIILEEEHAQIMRHGEVPSPEAAVSSSFINQFAKENRPHSPPSAAGVSGNASVTLMGQFPSSVSASMPSASDYTQHYSGASISIPVLTNEERKSSLGVSLSHVVGLFHSLTHHLMKERDTAPNSERSE